MLSPAGTFWIYCMRRVKQIIIVFFSLMIVAGESRAQDTTRVNESTTEENIALITMTGIIIPLAIIGTVVSAVPPSLSIVTRDGKSYGAVNIETGIGIGEMKETGIFSDWRLGLSYTFIVHSRIRNIFRTEMKRDVHFDFVDRRKIFLSGIHLSAGLLSDFPNRGYSVGAGLWLKSPWIGYFGFFPQHTYGITYRYNEYFQGKAFHEITLGMTSAFTF